MEHVSKKVSGFISVLMLLFVFVCVNTVNADEEKEDVKAVKKEVPCVEFKKPNHDFGEVLQNAKAKHTFTFKNTGKSKLVIEKVKAG